MMAALSSWAQSERYHSAEVRIEPTCLDMPWKNLDNPVLSHAVSTRSHENDLSDAHLFIRSIHLTQGIADLADRRVSADALNDVGHGVGIADPAILRHHGCLCCGLLDCL